MANTVMGAPIIPENLSWEDYNLIADAMKLLAEDARTTGLFPNQVESLIQNKYMLDLLMKFMDGPFSEETINSQLSLVRSISVNDFIAMGVLMLHDGYKPDQIYCFLTTIGELRQRVTK